MVKHDFTDGELALIDQAAFRAANVVAERLQASIATQMELHQARCPLKEVIAAVEDKGKEVAQRLDTIKAYGAGWIAGISMIAVVVVWVAKASWDYFRHN